MTFVDSRASGVDRRSMTTGRKHLMGQEKCQNCLAGASRERVKTSPSRGNGPLSRVSRFPASEKRRKEGRARTENSVRRERASRIREVRVKTNKKQAATTSLDEETKRCRQRCSATTNGEATYTQGRRRNPPPTLRSAPQQLSVSSHPSQARKESSSNTFVTRIYYHDHDDCAAANAASPVPAGASSTPRRRRRRRRAARSKHEPPRSSPPPPALPRPGRVVVVTFGRRGGRPKGRHAAAAQGPPPPPKVEPPRGGAAVAAAARSTGPARSIKWRATDPATAVAFADPAPQSSPGR
jgi:hypothetical protein